MSSVFEKGKDFEYRIKGLEEGTWRAIGYLDSKDIREAADLQHQTLNELADYIDELRS